MSDKMIISSIICILGINMNILFMILKRPMLKKNEYIYYIFRGIMFLIFYFFSISIYYRIFLHLNLTRSIFMSYIMITLLFIDILIDFNYRKLVVILMCIFAIIYYPNLLENLMLMNFIIFLYELYEIYLLNKQRKLFTSRLSIKQAFDTMDDGILFLDDNYNVLLMNDSMIEIVNNCELEYSLGEEELFKKIIDNIENTFFKINNQTFNVVTGNSIHYFKGNYYHFINVSKYFVLLEQLQNQNNFLISKQNELKQSILNIEQTIYDNEIMNVRYRIHDIIGQRLSIVHSYIVNMNFENDNLKELKLMLKNMRNDLIVESNLTIKNRFETLRKTYELVNTKIKLKGDFPDDDNLSLIFLKIIREASTNAIRHAGARNVFVTINETNEKIILSIINDGSISSNKIIEGDGIKGMRISLLPYNSKLIVKTKPMFEINAEVKKDIN